MLKLFEGPLVSPSGLSFRPGAEDPEMMRVVRVEQYALSRDVAFARANLTTNPKAFLATPEVFAHLDGEGEALPLTFVDGTCVLKGRYPTDGEFAKWLGLPEIAEGAPELTEDTLELLRMEAAVWGGCGPADCGGCAGCGSVPEESEIL